MATRNRRKTDQSPAEVDLKPHALAVDDDAAYLRLLERMLSEVGFEVTLADSGAAAIDALGGDDFDLVLLDLKMPGLDGFETFDQIRGGREKPYCILITGNDNLEIRVEAFNRGFDDFVSKMSNPLEIIAKLNAARRIVSIQRRLRDENNELLQLAMTDQLTGLYNRFYLFNRARELSASAKRIHVALFDLNGFKRINDRFGHLTGDRILADLGLSIRNALRETDIISRFGGDEFVLLLIDLPRAEAERIVARLVEHVAAMSWNIAGEEVSVTCSYGLATSEGREKSLPELLSECDAQLYEQKKRHGLADDTAAPLITTEFRRREPTL